MGVTHLKKNFFLFLLRTSGDWASGRGSAVFGFLKFEHMQVWDSVLDFVPVLSFYDWAISWFLGFAMEWGWMFFEAMFMVKSVVSLVVTTDSTPSPVMINIVWGYPWHIGHWWDFTIRPSPPSSPQITIDLLMSLEVFCAGSKSLGGQLQVPCF